VRTAAALLVLCAALEATAAPPPGATFAADERGRRFRVAFDPGHRWLVGGSWSASVGGHGRSEQGMGRIEARLLHRHLLGFPEEDVAWKMYQEILSVRLWEGGAPERPLVRLLAYRGTFVRWMKSGFVTIPSSPPKRIPFPLSIGVEVAAGELRTLPESVLAAEIGVVRSEVLFDFWRSRSMGSFAQVGMGPSYDLWLLCPEAGDVGLAHVVAPFSLATASFHHEWWGGKQAVDVRTAFAWAWSSAAGFGPRASASAEYEVVLLAVNDHPVSLFAEAEYHFEGLLQERDPGRHDLRTALGVRLGWPLD